MSGFLHFDKLEEDLAILLSIVAAQATTEGYWKREELGACLPYTPWPTVEALVEEKLISTAIQLRMVEDKFLRHGFLPRYPYSGEALLSVVEGSPVGNDGKSGLRVVCDKVIHADRISLYQQSLYSSITIQGQNKGRPWGIKVDLANYALNGLCLVAQYEDNWTISTRTEEKGMI